MLELGKVPDVSPLCGLITHHLQLQQNYIQLVKRNREIGNER
ncbi:hypothetical protein [Methanomethylovorans sp. PtaU1.Bin093]|nr:hypothetical protein [Methanomethylovorans sp. PtaU1.Bin093]